MQKPHFCRDLIGFYFFEAILLEIIEDLNRVKHSDKHFPIEGIKDLSNYLIYQVICLVDIYFLWIYI